MSLREGVLGLGFRVFVFSFFGGGGGHVTQGPPLLPKAPEVSLKIPPPQGPYN